LLRLGLATVMATLLLKWQAVIRRRERPSGGRISRGLSACVAKVRVTALPLTILGLDLAIRVSPGRMGTQPATLVVACKTGEKQP
jgi:hypothetical protein